MKYKNTQDLYEVVSHNMSIAWVLTTVFYLEVIPIIWWFLWNNIFYNEQV